MGIESTKHSYLLSDFFGSKLVINTQYIASATLLTGSNIFILQIFSLLAIFLILILIALFGIKKEAIILVSILFIIFILSSKIENKKINLIWSIRFSKFLKSNKLATTQKIENRTEILDSANILYWIDAKNNFHLQVYAQGKDYSHKIQNLDTELMSFLELPIADKLITASYTEYIFKIVNGDRQTMSEAFRLRNNDKYILKLNEHFDWNVIKHPHCLVAGGTGSGKTLILFQIVLSALEIQGDIAIIDPKRSDLFNVGERYFPTSTVSETAQIIELLKNYTQIMDDRYTQFLSSEIMIGASIKDLNLQPIFIFFDEVSAAMIGAEPKEKKEIMKYLTQLILKGRQAGINLILATQRPDADVISANLRDQLSVRIALGNLSADGKKMMFGSLDRELLNFSSDEKGVGYIQIWGLHSQPQEFRATFWNQEFNYPTKLNELLRQQ